MKSYERLVRRLNEIGHLQSVVRLLSWDQQLNLPRRAQQDRGEQASIISRLAHEALVCEETSAILEELKQTENELPDPKRVNIRETRRMYERERRLPSKLVEEISRAFSKGYSAWERAKEESNFSLFAPCLQRNIELQQQAAKHFGYVNDPYDALLEGNEVGTSTMEISKLFSDLKENLVRLLAEIKRPRQSPSLSSLNLHFDKSMQMPYLRDLILKLGFDPDSGRIDQATHPFVTQLGSEDVRISTWYLESNPLGSILAATHETGHALYRQGFDTQYWNTPMAMIASAGIDESQARFWENIIGRSREFCRYISPKLESAFPDHASHFSPESVYSQLNAVNPGLWRVHADEVTYNLHIILRFELECDLINNRLAVDELPEAWNKRMQESLGITPGNDAEGVLQDPHWSDMMFGYFPTYALGNVYSAQFAEALRRDCGDFDQLVAAGEFQPIRNWLKDKVHRQGMRFQPAELIRQATGAAPSSKPLVDYLSKKHLSTDLSSN